MFLYYGKDRTVFDNIKKALMNIANVLEVRFYNQELFFQENKVDFIFLDFGSKELDINKCIEEINLYTKNVKLIALINKNTSFDELINRNINCFLERDNITLEKIDNLINNFSSKLDCKLNKVNGKKIKNLRAILNNVNAFIAIKNKNRKYTYVNDKMASFINLDIDDILGKKDIEIFGENKSNKTWEINNEVLKSGKIHTIEEEICDKNNEKRVFETTKIPFNVENGEYEIMEFSVDVTKKVIYREKLKKMTVTDSLTNAYNRRYFNLECEREFLRSKRYNGTFSIIALDVDLFKKINDKHGHLIGDEVLIKATELCKKIIRENDEFFRIGGEEFAIIAPNTEKEEVYKLAKRIHKIFNDDPFKYCWDGEIKITFSIGISSMLKMDKKSEDVYKRADDALYVAKTTGRNKINIYGE